MLRSPPGSPLRRQFFATGMREWAEAFNRRDYDAIVMAFDPEIVIETGDALPDGNVYYGLDGYRRFLAMLEEVWGDYRIEPETVIDLGERYVVLARHRAHGRGSGAGVDHRVGMVGTLDAGVIRHMRFYWFTGDALEAAGLSA